MHLHYSSISFSEYSNNLKLDQLNLQFRLGSIHFYFLICVFFACLMRRAGLVQLVSASSPSHQVLGSKPSLCRISAGVRLCFGYSFPQTPLVWEPLALGLPFFFCLLDEIEAKFLIAIVCWQHSNLWIQSLYIKFEKWNFPSLCGQIFVRDKVKWLHHLPKVEMWGD
jgi:hypothetical protein